MRRPFVLRAQADDVSLARAIARALVAPLAERGARVLLDGSHEAGEKSAHGVHVLSATRGLPGASLAIGVWDPDEGARWLAPLELPSEPQTAAAKAIAFLEEWGFIGAKRSVKRAA